MNFVKQIYIVALALFPACLMGMELPSNTDHGILKKYDKHGAPITLEWYKTHDAKTLSDLLKPLIPVMADAFADEAILFRNFLFDEERQTIKPECAALLEELPAEVRQWIDVRIHLGAQDRQTRFAGTLASYEQKFEKEFIAKWAPVNPFVVIAKEGEKVLGMMLFCRISLEPELELPKNAVYVDEFGVKAEAQGRGIGKLLLFSVFELCSDVTQIFLDTGIWNTKAQAVYKALGFNVRECKEFAHVGFQFIKK